MRVGVSKASPSVRAGSNGAGASQPSPLLVTTRRTSEKPFECTPEEAIPSTMSPATISGGPARDAGRVKTGGPVGARHLGGLPADQRAAGQAAARGDALDHARADFG